MRSSIRPRSRGRHARFGARTQALALTVTLIAALGLALAGCGRGGGGGGAGGGALAVPAPPAPPASERWSEPQRLYYDNGGGIPDSARIVVRDEGALAERWRQATSRQATPPAVPAVDFERDVVVLVAAGRMTTEDQIRLDSAVVVQAPDEAGALRPELHLFVRTTRGCGRFNVDAWPLEIVRLRRFDGPIRFRETLVMAEGCNDG